jgi:ferredoxin-NADP reductase/MOSC domain-containing protein YiiM/ferredoxin
MPRLISVNVGLPRDVEWRSKTVRTAIWKTPVSDRRMVRRLNIDGDAQADLTGHGGEIRAVMVYQVDSYRYWESQLQRNDLTYGHFGENFTVEGLADDEVCIGDRYRIGDALFEVTQPRVTCYRVGIRLNEPQMPALLVSHHRPGFYFRVLETGLVGPGDEIRKVAEGPEKITVAEIDSLLYLPGHPRERLERSLRIPALSPGWKKSLHSLLEQSVKGTSENGNAGLSASTSPVPAWTGFRSLAVSRINRESASVLSVYLESPDRSPLPSALPGQFLVIRVRPIEDQPAILRNYSLSGAPDAGIYRISVKKEMQGIGSNFLHSGLKAGDAVEVSAPRGNFTLQPGEGPVVLLSAGIGITPVLAMLHWLKSQGSHRTVWWLYGARNRDEHPFAEEASELVAALPNGRRYIVYSKPGPDDKVGEDFDFAGHLDLAAFEELRIPKESDFYLCGPATFLNTFTSGLKEWGVETQLIHSEAFGPAAAFAPNVVSDSSKRSTLSRLTQGPGPQIDFVRSGMSVSWGQQFSSLLELAEAFDIPVRWSCRTGVCHTCECSLIGGDVDYSPAPVELPAVGNILLCCARPKSDLQLDL